MKSELVLAVATSEVSGALACPRHISSAAPAPLLAFDLAFVTFGLAFAAMGSHTVARTAVKDMNTPQRKQHRAKLQREREAFNRDAKEAIRRARRDAALAVRVQVAAELAADEAKDVAARAKEKVLALLTPNTRLRLEKKRERDSDEAAVQQADTVREELENDEAGEDDEEQPVLQYSYEPQQPEPEPEEEPEPQPKPDSQQISTALQVNPLPPNPLYRANRAAASNDSLTEGMRHMFRGSAMDENEN